MDQNLAVVLVVLAFGGVLASIIAYSRTQSGAAAVVFFFFGAVLPLIGIIVACLVKPVQGPPQPPGWAPDPWREAPLRWWDGQAWGWQTSYGALHNDPGTAG